MPKISKTMCIEMGHRLPNHNGKCRNLHGHSWEIEVSITDLIIEEQGHPSEGMVCDFGTLKTAMSIIDRDFDHKMCLQYTDPLLNRLVDDYEKIYQASIATMLRSENYVVLDTNKLSANKENQIYTLVALPPTSEVLANIWRKIICRQFYPEKIIGISVKETATSCVELS